MSIPFLVVAVVLFPSVVAYRAFREEAITKSDLRFMYGISALMACWVVIAATAGYLGIWLEEDFVATLPGLWLPLVPVAVAMLPLLVPRIRSVVIRTGRSTPWTWFATIQALRIAAIGTAIKTYHGEFPETVEYLMGIPDLVFGLSALWVLRLAARKRLSKTSWIIWNGLGLGIIVPVGMIVINLSMPGPFNAFSANPSFLVAFEFPLSLAPTAVVPWLVVFNLWAMTCSMPSQNPVLT